MTFLLQPIEWELNPFFKQMDKEDAKKPMLK
jgi:hypothetical protein